MKLQELITDRLNRLKEDIVRNIEAENITASGRTQRSLEVEPYKGGVRLVAREGNRAPMETLEVGREGGKVPKRFYLILAQWSIEKGIPFPSERERRTFAYFLGKRIAREGTLRHKNNVDVYTQLVDECADEIKNRLLVEIQQTITSV